MDNKKMDKEFKMFKPNQDQTERKSLLKQFIHEEIVENIDDLDETQVKLAKEFD